MIDFRLVAASAAARSAAWLGKRFGKGGTSLPGKILLKLDSRAIAKLSARIVGGNHLITATNGKTTTASLVAGAFAQANKGCVHNDSGANMAGGVAGALLATDVLDSAAAVGLFEIDEFWLPALGPDLKPRSLLIGNLFRDQLDRYGELDSILERWSVVVPLLAASGTQVILNADDPGVASLAGLLPAEAVTWFGINDTRHALDQLPHSADSAECRTCGTALEYAAVILGHLGHWSCPGCGARRPDPDWAIDQLDLLGANGIRLTVCDPAGNQHEVEVALPGVYNAYNVLAGWAQSALAGCTPAQISYSLQQAKPAFGRAESLMIGSSRASLMLIKNPTGANEVIRTLVHENGELTLVVALNDQIADGRDVSWVWDADFELLSDRVRRVYCCGRRAAEMALRLRYGGFPAEQIVCIDSTIEATLKAASESDQVWVLPTYTAMLELRSELERTGLIA